MDLRKKKTITSIKNAFIELRSKKPLYKITVKELCEIALISKPTFYLHYADIYDLSEQMEHEIINSIISSTNFIDDPFTDFNLKYNMLLQNFFSQGQLLNIIFSYDRKAEFSSQLEKAFKERFFNSFPEFIDDVNARILIDFLVYGTFHTFIMNSDIDFNEISNTLTSLVEKLLDSLDLLKK